SFSFSLSFSSLSPSAPPPSVPFLIIRAMSDVGDEDAGQSFDEFIIEAGKKSANMILNFLKK
ncbi:5'-methylthioadenosine/S-adenosylhomocysteine nucleosidase, partial [Lactobacillus salivarius]|nr:5'-methylthioadenosine/S-adenosylhomocysteine nucleosidase [Ligilactobacillus salivarius]